MRHDEQLRIELQGQYDTLTAHIAAIDRDLATALDAERRLILQEKRTELDGERQSVIDRMQVLPAGRDAIATAAIAARGNRIVEYDELMRMIYEIRSDVAIMKRLFDDHLKTCGENSAGFPPSFLALLAVGGVATLILLAFIVIRIGMPG